MSETPFDAFTGSWKVRDPLPDPPPWRDFPERCPEEPAPAEGPFEGNTTEVERRALKHYLPPKSKAAQAVWAALVLRRPLLITGHPGVGKSSLAYVAAHHLELGPVLRWNVNSRSTVAHGLYEYDAIGRFQKIQRLQLLEKDNEEALRLAKHPGEFFRLGPLGTALLPRKVPRVLLIDEIDKSDLDLPNDLLHVLEEGWFDVPELRRLGRDSDVDVETADAAGDTAKILGGRVHCHEFPLIIMTSNGERDFPAAFLRRCLRLKIERPTAATLEEIVKKHLSVDTLSGDKKTLFDRLSGDLVNRVRENTTDQLLNTFFAEAERDFDYSVEEITYGDVSQSDNVD